MKRLRRPRASAGSVMTAVSATVVAKQKESETQAVRRPDSRGAFVFPVLTRGCEPRNVPVARRFRITPRCPVANTLRGLCKTRRAGCDTVRTVWETFLPKG